MIYTKDKLIEEFISQVKRNTEAFDGVKSALEQINDQNILHAGRETERYETIQQLIKSNTAVLRIVNVILFLFFLTILALIILAGAETALKHVTVWPF